MKIKKIKTTYYKGIWLDFNKHMQGNNVITLYRITNNDLEYYHRYKQNWIKSIWFIDSIIKSPYIYGLKSFKRISKKEAFLELL